MGGFIMKKEYENYIFDLYGTLVDIQTNEKKASLWKNMAHIYSMTGAVYTASELRKRYRVLCGQETAAKAAKMGCRESEVEILLDRVFEKLFTDKGVCADKGQVYQTMITFRSLSLCYIRLFEGVPELFLRLKEAGKKCYLLSNAQRTFTEAEMKLLGIYGSFDGILYSSDAGVKKPSENFYHTLFQKYCLKKESSVMIGNEYQADVLGACDYGIDSIHVHVDQSGRRQGALPGNCVEIEKVGEVF